MIRIASALLLLAPAVAAGGARTAQLRVSAEVRRSVAVSVQATAGQPTLRVRTASGAVWSGPLGDPRAASAGAIRVEPSAADPAFVVVTVLADAAAPAR